MKIIVAVEHYISPEAVEGFKAVFAEHHKMVSQFSGFGGLKRGVSGEKSERHHIFMEFSSEEELMRWRQSSEHQQIAKAYAAVWMKAPTVHLVKIEEEKSI
jgi:heme-degrading monooxygenase HmoA